MKRSNQLNIKILFVISFYLLFALSGCDVLNPGLGEEIDKNDPAVGIESHGNGTYVGGVITLIGYASDDLGVSSVTVKHGDEEYEATLSGEQWSLELDTSVFPDGDFEITVTAVDKMGKEASVSSLLIVDNSPPSVIVTSPTSFNDYGDISNPDDDLLIRFNKSITIKGEAADTTRVKNVYVSLYREDGTPVLDNQLATGTSSWYFTFNSEDFHSAVKPAAIYYYFISAEDYSGNRSYYFYHLKETISLGSPNIEQINASDFQGETISGLESRRISTSGKRMDIVIDPDSDEPQFDFKTPSVVYSPDNPLSENRYSEVQKLLGYIYDDDFGDLTSVQLALFDYDTDDPVDINGNVVADSWISYAGSGLANESAAFTFSGTQWSLESTLPEGSYYIRMQASDVNSVSATSIDVPFSVSASAPTITILNPTPGEYVGDGQSVLVEVSVTNSDGSSWTGTEMYIDTDGNSSWDEGSAIVMTQDATGEFSLTITEDVTPGFSFTADETYTIRLKAGTGTSAGNATLGITADISKPTMQVTLPGNGVTVNGTVLMRGTSYDGVSGAISTVWIKKEAGDNAEYTSYPADPAAAGWTDISSSVYNWSHNIDTTAYPDPGVITVHYFVEDAAGNLGSTGVVDHPSRVTYSIDQSSDLPVITVTQPADGGRLGEGSSIIGSVSDDDMVDVSSLLISMDIGNDGSFEAPVPFSDPPLSDSTDVNFKHSLAGVPEGSHAFTIYVDDLKSNGDSVASSSLTYTFIVDGGPPSLVIDAMAKDLWDENVVITGNTADANGVASMAFSEDGSSWVPISITPTTDGSLINWSYTFAVDPNGANDKQYTSQIRSVDQAGATTTKYISFEVDTKAPVLKITQPPESVTVNGDAVYVGGTVSDVNSVTGLYYYITPDSAVPPTDQGDYTGWTSITPDYSWSFVFNSLSYDNDEIEGVYKIWLRAVDHIDILNETDDTLPEHSLVFTIDQKEDRPIITFNDIDESLTAASGNVLVGSTTLTGLVEDDDSIDPSVSIPIEISIDGDAWTAVDIKPQIGDAPKQTMVWQHDISGLLEGVHHVKVRARDSESEGASADSRADGLYTSDFNWNIMENADLSAANTDPDKSLGIPFIVNRGAPTISVSSPDNYSFHRTNVTISGESSDTNGVKKVEISFDNGATFPYSYNYDPAESPAVWSFTYPVASGEGVISYIIQATDAYDSTSIANGQFTLDVTVPTSVINLPSDGETVNGLMTMSGTAGDNINLSEVYYNVSLNSASVTWPGDYTLLGGTYSWSQGLDTTDVAYFDGNYILRVRSVDSAGNLSDIDSHAFEILQESDKPVISYSSILEAGTFADNLIPISKQIAGNITDDDGVDVSTIQYQLFEEDGASPVYPGDWDAGEIAAGWADISTPPGSDTTLATWTHSFDGSLADGKYQMRLRVADILAGGLFNGGEFDWNQSPPVQFAVDSANPVTTFDSPNGGSTNVDLYISGTASDANGVTNVDLSFNSGSTWIPADNFTTGTSEVWDYTHSLGSDGLLTYQVRVTDEYNKEQTYDRYITVDTTPATVAISQPSFGATVNGSIALRGTSDDTGSGVETVYFLVSDSAAAPAGLVGYAEASGTYNWSAVYDTGAVVDGVYYLHVKAVDVAENISSAVTSQLTIDQNSDKPIVSFSTLNDGGTFTDNLLPLSKQISGTVEDDDSVDASTVQYRLLQEDGSTEITGWSNVSGQPGSDSGFVTWTHTFGGTVFDGKYHVQIRVADINDGGSWDGLYDWAETAPVPFAVDSANPVTTFDSSNGGSTNTDIVISGTAGDANGVSSVEIGYDDDDSGVIDSDEWFSALNFITGSVSDAWDYTYSVDTATHSDDGLFKYQVRVTDAYNKEQVYDRNITIDTTPGSIVISQPSSLATINGLTTLRGTSDDSGSGVSRVQYGISASNSVAPSFTDASGTYNWSVPDYDTTGITGPETRFLWIRVEDLAGNISTPSVADFTIREFTIDQTSDIPVIEFLSITEGGSFGVNELPLAQKISGTVTDDDGIDASTLEYQIFAEDGSTPFYPDDWNPGEIAAGWAQISDQPDTDSTFGAWSHTFNPLIPDGKYQIRLRAADINDGGSFDGTYDWVQSGLQKITVDSLSPAGSIDTLAVNNTYSSGFGADTPVVSGMLVNDSFMLKGTASDGNGVSSVSISLDGGDFTVVDSYSAPDWNHTVPVTRGGGFDGELSILIRITDTVGKITDKTLSVTVDTVEPGSILNYNNEMSLQGSVPTVAGSLAKIIGSVTDAGDTSNTERVDLFFEKTDVAVDYFYSPRTADTREEVGTNVLPTVPSEYIISVNQLEIEDDDADGFIEGFRSKGTFDEWYVYFDSEKIPDGPLTIHRASYDSSGNRGIDSSAMQISNYPPAISSLSVFGTNYTEADARIKIADNNAGTVVIAATDDSHAPTGIDTSLYELEVIERYSISSGNVGTLLEQYASGTHLYSVSAAGVSETIDIDVDFANDFYYRVQARAVDVSGTVTSMDFYLWPFDSSTDSTAPTVNIDALTQEKNAGPNGHLEESGDSPNDGGDADISGTITFTGSVWDNNTSPSVVVQISYDSGTSWSAITGNAALANGTGDTIAGYTYDWSVDWDSSGVAGVAENDVQFRAFASDSAATPNTANSSTLQADVVPYITDITTGFEIGLKSFIKRSALGHYTVASGSSITIHGFNLAGTTAGSVAIGGSTLNPSSGSTTEQTVTLSSVHNGDVIVTTNGVSSQNNTNNNGLEQNKELDQSQYFPDRNDDRYISLWTLANTGFSGDDATMRPVRNASGEQIDMEWMYTTTSDTLYLGADKMTESFTLSGGDFGYNDNGTRLWTFLHNAKWWITNESNTWNANDEQYYGSIQWSMENGYTYTAERDEAYNWNIAAQTGRLGLGNMVYQAETLGQIDRYENLQMKIYGGNATTSNFVTYFDKNSAEKGLTFVSFNTGTSVANTNYDLGNSWYSTVERVNPYDKKYAPTGNEGQKATGIRNPEYAGTDTIARHNIIPGDDSSSDYQMVIDSSGAAYIVWYDPSTGGTGGFAGAGIKFMYNTDPVANPLNGWTDPETVASNGSNTSYSYITMAIDPDNGVHFAYQDDDTGYLNYTYAASRGDVGTTMNTLLLDALFSSGQYNSMVIKDFDTDTGTDYRPVITTFSSAYTGTSQALRIVYPAGDVGTVNLSSIGDGAFSSGAFTGNWESIAIPASTAPKTVQTFIETGGTASGQGNPLIGYNGDYMEEAIFHELD